MTTAEAAALIKRYLRGECTPEEAAQAESWYNRLARDRKELPETDRLDEHYLLALDAILQSRKPARPFHRRLLRYWPAAVALLVLSLGAYLYMQRSEGPQRPLEAADIAPGTNRATLTLADGRVVDLSEEQEGIIIQDGITYLDGSAVSPEVGKSGSQKDSPYGTENGNPSTDYYVLSTPKGGTYQVTLPDGSKVWLNSASTLKYPSRFSGDSREVVLQGEAYFDIEPVLSPARGGRERNSVGRGRLPFKVITNNQTVEVLGTQFNVSAYMDDPETKTTLVEGKVKVADYVLTPGQQATTRRSETQVIEVNTEQYTSWKDGYFSLKGTIPDILKEISRWYDLDVVYEGKPTDSIRVYFTIPRDLPLADVLYALQQADGGLRYRLEAVADGSKTQHNQRQAERRLTIFR